MFNGLLLKYLTVLHFHALEYSSTVTCYRHEVTCLNLDTLIKQTRLFFKQKKKVSIYVLFVFTAVTSARIQYKIALIDTVESCKQ